MFGWAVFFLIIALTAALFGFGGFAAVTIAQVLFFVFLALFVAAMMIGRRAAI